MFNRLEFMWRYLISDPVGFVVYMLYWVIVLVMSLVIHEYAHAYVAYRCGDPTAKMMGRLTLDPRRHLDPMGAVCMFFLGFGWAKPVPVNSRNFRKFRRDDILVSVAGITINFVIFLVSVLLSVIVNRIMMGEELLGSVQNTSDFIQQAVNPYRYSYAAAIMGGETSMMAFLAVPWLYYVQRLLLMLAQVNLALAVFNLIPIPPLDGYHLFNDLIFRGRFMLNGQTFVIAQTALMVLALSGALSGVLRVLNSGIYSLVAGAAALLVGG